MVPTFLSSALFSSLLRNACRWVIVTTGLPVYWHYQTHGVINPYQVGLSFFLGLNLIVCCWEMVLYYKIDLIERKCKFYFDHYPGRAMDIAVDVFNMDVNLRNVLDPELWAEVHPKKITSLRL